MLELNQPIHGSKTTKNRNIITYINLSHKDIILKETI